MLSLVPGWTGLNERTFIAVKPDGVQRKLVGEILRRFEKRGFKLVGLKLMQVCGMWFFQSPPKNIFPGDLKILFSLLNICLVCICISGI